MDISSGSLTRVVVAVDESEVSMEALKWALEKLKLSSSSPDSFVVLYVQPPPSIAAGLNPGPIPFAAPSGVEVPAFMSAIEQHQKRVTDAILEHARQICADRSVNVKTLVAIGDPKTEICDTVAKLSADLLVMGSRAHGPITRMFLGSVSNFCTNNASCPVVIFKTKGSSSE